MTPEGGEELTNIAIINVTAYYDNDPIETQTIDNLAPSTNMTVTIYWNTPNVTPQNYTIKAEATPVPGETSLSDNTYDDGAVNIKITGDVNGDGVVDMRDLSTVARHLGETA
jgi:hypothetical protein